MISLEGTKRFFGEARFLILGILIVIGLFLLADLTSSNKKKDSLVLPFRYGFGAGIPVSDVESFDFNKDGLQDLIATPTDNRKPGLFINKGHFRFQDVSKKHDINIFGGNGLASGDINNDGYDDVVVAGGEGDVILLNKEGQSFKEIELSKHIGVSKSVSVALCDVDKNGFVDMYFGRDTLFHDRVGNALVLNLRGQEFRDVTSEVGLGSGFSKNIADNRQHASWAVSCFDFDLDGDEDIFVAAEFAAVALFENKLSDEGELRFEDISLRAGFSETGNWMGMVPFLDDEGRLNLFITNWGSSAAYDDSDRVDTLEHRLYSYINNKFIDISKKVARFPFGWGATALDWNADGLRDIYYTGNLIDFYKVSEVSIYNKDVVDNPGILFLGGEGGFVNKALSNKDSNGFWGEGKGVLSEDLDGDGLEEIIISNRLHFDPEGDSAQDQETELSLGGINIIKNNTKLENQTYVQIVLQGKSVNRSAIGSRIEVTTNSGKKGHFQIISESFSHTSRYPRVYLKENERITSIKVFWPGGKIQTEKENTEGPLIRITEEDDA